MPLKPKERLAPDDARQRLRRDNPPNQEGLRRLRQWRKDWQDVQVPLLLPRDGRLATGLEGGGIVESLRILAGLENSRDPHTKPTELADDTLPLRGLYALSRDTPTFRSLPPHIRRIYPKALPPRTDGPYPRPPVRNIRSHPGLWALPAPPTTRFLRRRFRSVWSRLPWVRYVQKEGWRKCDFDDIRGDLGLDEALLIGGEGQNPSSSTWSTGSDAERRFL